MELHRMIVSELIDNVKAEFEQINMPIYNNDPSELDKVIKDRLENKLAAKLFCLRRIKSTLDFFELDCARLDDLLIEFKDFQPEHYEHNLGQKNEYLAQENKVLRQMLSFLVGEGLKDTTAAEMQKKVYGTWDHFDLLEIYKKNDINW